MTTYSKEDLFNKVGDELGASDWFVIDQERINQFADVTLDHQFIHIDTEAAKQTPFGTTIAHGFLTLSMLTHLLESLTLRLEGAAMGVNYGFDKVRFLAPVAAGSAVRSVAKLVSVDEKKPGQFLIKYGVTIEIQGSDTPALIAEWLVMDFTQ